MNYKRIEDTDMPIFGEVLHIIFGSQCIEVFVCLEFEESKSFDDILEIAKKNGYKRGTLYLIAQNPLHGNMYRYNAYAEAFWEEWGENRGYA